MEKNERYTDEKVHVFEKAGLGKAPYKFLGEFKNVYQACPDAPQQPGGSCSYCGTAIMYEYHLQSRVDGSTFKVGCECIRRAGDSGLQKSIKPAIAKRERENRQRLQEEKRAKLLAILDDPTNRQKLDRLPSPWSPNRPLLGYLEGCVNHAGAGIAKALKLAAASIEKDVDLASDPIRPPAPAPRPKSSRQLLEEAIAIETTREALRFERHPKIKRLTFLDYVDYCIPCAGEARLADILADVQAIVRIREDRI